MTSCLKRPFIIKKATWKHELTGSALVTPLFIFQDSKKNYENKNYHCSIIADVFGSGEK